MTQAGNYLAKCIKEVSKEIENALDEENTLTKEKFAEILNKNIDSMHAELTEGEEWPITLATVNILVLLISNFSVFERMSFMEANNNNKLNKMARKRVLKKAFDIMFEQAELMATEDQSIVKASQQS